MKNNDILTEIKNSEKSIFVSANAGSGKTFILVARVLGLLLSGVSGRKILCISFTEAAAGEIKERIKHALLEIEKHPLMKDKTKEEITKAKLLYKEVVLENNMPRILTFHGFCMEVIRAFSYEVGVLYRPQILTSGRQSMIKREIYKNLFLKESTKNLVKQIKYAFTGFTIENKILPQILKLNLAETSIWEKLEAEPFNEDLKEKIKQMEKDLLDSFDFFSLAKILEAFERTEDKKSVLIKKALNEKSVLNLTEALLTSDLKQSKRFIFKKHLQVLPEAEEIYFNLCKRLTSYLEVRNKIVTAKITESVIKLTEEILNEYEKYKKSIGCVDFEDLISIAKTAMTSENRDFILFKIDGGLEHILVDEAQDTNFTQWNILFSILEEFFGGKGRSEVTKSLFVVGDEKQSIFSFQGAEPEVFNFVKNKYKEILHVHFLNESYRSSQVILDLVDSIFSPIFPNYQKHIAKFESYGIIEVLEIPLKPERLKQEMETWKMPWEERQEETLKDLQAKQITDKILEILETKRALPCDFLLLSKSRDAELFSKIKAILRQSKIGVSFGDDVLLSESYIINDFLAILKFLLNPRQKLSLAIVLKSPIFNYGDEEFEDFFSRPLPVPSEIKNLSFLLNGSIESFFTHLIATFGKFYEDSEIKEAAYIFNLIQEYKGTGFEGFVYFIEELKNINYKFKIDFAPSQNSVKINTVHSAKGLESKIVFILNATEGLSKESAKENFAFGKNFFLVSKKEYATPLWQSLKEEKKKKEYAEYLRLLYVAITRAENELYVFGKELSKNEDEFESWYTKIRNNVKINQVGNYKFTEMQNEDKKQIIIVPPSSPIQAPLKVYKKATTDAVKSKSLEIGSLIHFLLENKFETISPELYSFLQGKFNMLAQEDIESAFKISIITKNNFPNLFKENAYSEVEVEVLEYSQITKVKIDKLIIKPDEIQIIDFKYHEEEIITPSIKNQLQIYKQAIEKIYRTHKVRCFILWIKNQNLEQVEI